MNNDKERKFKIEKKKLALLAGACALVVGGGTYALVNRDQPEPDKRVATSQPVQPKSKKKNSKSKLQGEKTENSSSDDVLNDVLSTYDIPEVPNNSRSSSSRSVNTLSPVEIATVANTLGNRENESTKTTPVQTLATNNPVSDSKEKESNKVTDNQVIVPIVPPTTDPEQPVDPEQPKPDPEIPSVIETTPSITVVNEPVKINEGEEFDPIHYYAVSDSGDRNPIISYSKNTLKIGRNEIIITAKNKFGNSASAVLIVIVNSKPILTANGSLSIDVSIHTTPDYRSYVSAWDLEDGDISNRIDIDGVADTDIEGSYEVTYNVFDNDGAKASSLVLTFNIVNEAPVIHASDREISLEDDLYDPLLNVSVSDLEDDRDGYPIDLTHSNILENTVDITTEGEYTISVGNIKDRDGKEAAQVTFTVRVTNAAPELTVPDYTLQVGDLFDLEGYRRSISVTDREDDRKGIIPELTISQEDLDRIDTTQEGSYPVNITATDSHGKSTTIIGNVIVVPAEPAEPIEPVE